MATDESDPAQGRAAEWVETAPGAFRVHELRLRDVKISLARRDRWYVTASPTLFHERALRASLLDDGAAKSEAMLVVHEIAMRLAADVVATGRGMFGE